MTEYWSDASVVGGKNESKSARHESEERRNMRNSESEGPTKKERKQQHESSQKTEYENTRAVARSSNADRNAAKYSSNEDHGRYNRRNERDEERSRHERREVETEDDEIEVEVDVEEEEDESYNVSMEYRSETKYQVESKTYYENHNGGGGGGGGNDDYRHNDVGSKYDNDKSSGASSTSQSSDSEDEGTIPDTGGRKVEQIAQKLEQTAQKYAREHSPPKFIERRGMSSNSNSLDRSHDQQEVASKSFDKYEREMRSVRASVQRSSNASADRYTDKSVASSRQSTLTHERGSYEKNPETRKRNSAGSRGFERPRPPSQEAPERPTEQQLREQRYRERRYSDKEDIYGETSTMGFANESVVMDKDRGYESNFETKLERTKVLERVHGYPRNPSVIEGQNDTNNNSLKSDGRKPMLPRQSTAMGHLVQTGRGFEAENKSPKLVKRTKSFWRFRRDSEVLEGMALWQHRSLVDIPKMLKRDSKEERAKSRDESRKSSSEGSPGPSHRSLERKNSGSTITNERINGNSIEQLTADEPKPAERMHLPDKSTSSLDYFDDPLPTPAERPNRSGEYRSPTRSQHEEPRSYFVGNVSRKAILENERKRSMEAKRNMIVAELKENNSQQQQQQQQQQQKRNSNGSSSNNNPERRKKGSYGNDDDDGLMMPIQHHHHFTETEASDEESTYSCIIVKDQAVSEKTLLPRTKLRRDSERTDRNSKKTACGPWYDLWGVDQSVTNNKKKKKQKQQ